MPPLVSQFCAHHVGPEDFPEPELEVENPRIPSIADPEVPGAGSKLYHASREMTTQSLGNQFSNSALMILFKSDAPLSWVTGRTEVPILRWREEQSSFCDTLIVGTSWQISSWERSALECRQMEDFKYFFRKMALKLNGIDPTTKSRLRYPLSQPFDSHNPLLL